MGLKIDQLKGPNKPDDETVEQYRVITGATRIKVEQGDDGVWTAEAFFDDEPEA